VRCGPQLADWFVTRVELLPVPHCSQQRCNHGQLESNLWPVQRPRAVVLPPSRFWVLPTQKRCKMVLTG
jgi:hypothetical protein